MRVPLYVCDCVPACVRVPAFVCVCLWLCLDGGQPVPEALGGCVPAALQRAEQQCGAAFPGQHSER